jgi:hypothetical protein
MKNILGKEMKSTRKEMKNILGNEMKNPQKE